MARQWIFWFEELGTEHNNLVGKKCANLGELTRIEMPVPPGFALCLDAYKRFLTESGAQEEIEEYLQRHADDFSNLRHLSRLSAEIRQIVESKRIPKDMANTIISYYNSLSRKCGTSNVAVSVRSAGPVSHPGQYETYLNVKGEVEVLEKIKKVWSSSFNPRSLAYRAKNNLPLEYDPIGVCIVRMVDAKVAGVILTADPNTGNRTRIVCEANWGLGESVVSGVVTPDVFVLDKDTLTVLERKKGQKERCIMCNATGVREEDVPHNKSQSYCLSDDELKKLARLAINLEQHFGVPQDVEWALDKEDNVFLLQTRPAIIADQKSDIDTILDLIMRLRA